MARLQPQRGPIPYAEPGPLTAPFWKGCADGELRYQRCTSCGQPDFPPASHCRTCQSPDLAWEVSAGLGAVYSWTLVWRPVTPAFEAPYAPAIVDLDEGYQLMTNLVDLDVDDVRVGLRVRVAFHSVAEGLTLPYFTPVEGS